MNIFESSRHRSADEKAKKTKQKATRKQNPFRLSAGPGTGVYVSSYTDPMFIDYCVSLDDAFLLRSAFREASREEKTSNKHRSKWVKHKIRQRRREISRLETSAAFCCRDLLNNLLHFARVYIFSLSFSVCSKLLSFARHRGSGATEPFAHISPIAGSLTFSPNRCCLQIDNSFLSLFIVHLSSTGLTFSFFFLVHVYQ